jgi:ATP-dependent Lon protease
MYERDFYKKVIKRTLLSVQKYKKIEIVTNTDINICIKALEVLYDQCRTDISKENLKTVKNDLLVLLKSYGTTHMADLLELLLGEDALLEFSSNDKFEIINKYVHPISYKIVSTTNKKGTVILSKHTKLLEPDIIKRATHLECYDLCRSTSQFYLRVYGIKIVLKYGNSTVLVNGIVDDLYLNHLDYAYTMKYSAVLEKSKLPDSYKQMVTLKDQLIYSIEDLVYKYEGVATDIKVLKLQTLNEMVNEFMNSGTYIKRMMLIKLLSDRENIENLYIAYLLYDLLSPTSDVILMVPEQTIILDSFPWSVRMAFKGAMKHTIEYSNKLNNFDGSTIPLDQQICLLKASDSVKEKAMSKLKEVKSKSEEGGSKAKHYLEGLLKIPFNKFISEPILNYITNICDKIKQLQLPMHSSTSLNAINTTIKKLLVDSKPDIIKAVSQHLGQSTKKVLVAILVVINDMVKRHQFEYDIVQPTMKKPVIKSHILSFIKKYYHNVHILELFNNGVLREVEVELFRLYVDIHDTKSLVNSYINNVRTILDKSVYGHDPAKRHIERIIGQWISGDQKGYSIGFEGPPGIGKTSLAKYGISKCLVDGDGNSRPFAFIGIGGDANASTIVGHNYTYVGSNWGKLVEVLIEKQCMNPIIFFDELDKVSNTEQGREIIGILTHLIDSTQNTHFQDKFFSGIDLDLSKALFIFSYNDPDRIDKVLLDRIHRIQFLHLSLEEKLIIAADYLLPELFQNTNLHNAVSFSDDIIKYIINTYTYEPGVRKLKDILFEIVGEINLELLKDNVEHELPICITTEMIQNKYLKSKSPIRIQKIILSPQIGVINGLWANSYGKGGIITIESAYILAANPLELKLTGCQGNVMKESMEVAKTVAWNLVSSDIQENNLVNYKNTQLQGIHVHTPEGGTPKDGPSAGAAITTVLYSLFSGKEIKNTLAITGEINLSGKITAIGGLDLKIIGGIYAGVTEFLYPDENTFEFNIFINKYKDNPIMENITFHPVKNIHDVFKFAFI